MKDPYATLGVPRTASDSDIKAAYRKLAKELHPDLNKDDAKVADRFKEVSSAYATLSDKAKRAAFDAGHQGPRPAPGSRGPQRTTDPFSAFRTYRQNAEASQRSRSREETRRSSGKAKFSGTDDDDVEDLFSDLFGFSKSPGADNRRTGGKEDRNTKKPEDQQYRLAVSFTEGARGCTKRITLTSGKTLDVKIPAGVTDGQQIRLPGQGKPTADGAGDALVTVSVSDHPFFQLDGKDILLELPIRVDEAVLGGKVQIPTLDGKVALAIPKNASSGKKLRLKGRGYGPEGGRGDQYITLKIMLPDQPDEKLEKMMEEYARNGGYTVRDGFD